MTRGKDLVDKCFEGIRNIVYISLKSVQSVIINDKHCFEIYGFNVTSLKEKPTKLESTRK